MNPQIQPEGYLIRLPFYVVGRKDAHILLSPVEHPETRADVYEIGEYHFILHWTRSTAIALKLIFPKGSNYSWIQK